MCVVEVEGFTRVPSCSHPVAEGMKIRTNTPAVMQARKTIIELLLASNHPDDCLYCARNGNCDLAKLAAENGVRDRAFQATARAGPRTSPVPPSSGIRRSASFAASAPSLREEVQGVSAIDFVNRGSRAYVGTAFNLGLNVSSCINCGQCILVCPTAALSEHKACGRGDAGPRCCR